MKAPVYLYYRLDNYYQNHRRYVKSRNDNQLRGIGGEDYTALQDCDPVIGPGSPSKDTPVDQLYFPCGLIAKSVFNGMFIRFITHLTCYDRHFCNVQA